MFQVLRVRQSKKRSHAESQKPEVSDSDEETLAGELPVINFELQTFDSVSSTLDLKHQSLNFELGKLR